MEEVITKTLICDVETNALRGYTKLWCAVTYCLETEELKVFSYKKDDSHVAAFKDYIKDTDHWIGHNFIAFDRHVIHHFTDVFIPCSRISDTLVRSRLFNSGRDGGHSLERWGSYFGVPKVGADYEDWDRYDPIVTKRCVTDVAITHKLWKFQQKEGAAVSPNAIQIEQRFVELAERIKANGFPIDKDLLDKKYTAMAAERTELENRIRTAFPPRPVKVADVNPRQTKSGAFAKNTKGFSQFKDCGIIKGPFTLIEWQEFNIGSPTQVVERMDAWGWKPTVRTKSGKSWKVCEENLDTLPDTAPEEAKLIASFLKLKTRLQLIENWYENLVQEQDGRHRVHGSIIHIGAVTHRCAHKDPNTANIPGNDDEVYRIREAWGVEHLDPDLRIVGADAKGIQMRILAHLLAKYTNDRSFVDACLHGDIHVDFSLPILQKACPDSPLLFPTETRDIHWIKQNVTKRYNYAYVLGMGNEKAGTLLGVDKHKGKISKEAFTNAFPGMNELNQELARAAERGWWKAPDGRYLPIASLFKALSVLLQGIESIIMKLAGLLWQQEVDRLSIPAVIAAFVHDEYQMIARSKHADQVGQLMVDCIVKAGEMLNLRVPMGGDYKVGRTWKDTH